MRESFFTLGELTETKITGEKKTSSLVVCMTATQQSHDNEPKLNEAHFSVIKYQEKVQIIKTPVLI